MCSETHHSRLQLGECVRRVRACIHCAEATASIPHPSALGLSPSHHLYPAPGDHHLPSVTTDRSCGNRFEKRGLTFSYSLIRRSHAMQASIVVAKMFKAIIRRKVCY